MNTQMNPTDAEIAGKLDGMKRGNLQLDSFEGELWLTIRNKHRGVDIFVDGNVLPSDLLAFCRAVLGKVDGVVKTPKSCGEYLKLSEKEKLRLMKQEASK